VEAQDLERWNVQSDNPVTGEDLSILKRKFDGYLAACASADGGHHPLLELKVGHSTRVAEEARTLSCDLGWPVSEQNIAEALGLVHDIGRFSQFLEYGTFSDEASVDHGERGWAVATRTRLLLNIPAVEGEWILDGIRYHNRRAIPEGISCGSLPFLRLVRDADKLDIFRVVLDAVGRDGFRDLPRMLPGVVLGRSVSSGIIDEVESCGNCSLGSVRSVGDFLLMQLSWISNLHYAATVQRIFDREIISRIMRHVDDTPRIRSLRETICRDAAERLNGTRQS